ncbi:uncharacterized protein LOC133517247 isoform X1 [Cydia pomonella]|uniref:uncharacterized protein LOC133517247 isoform X1 n=1 Tax=Cydia pomonella TaxID=82600 RepID=UPI002ADD9575|nr:uncharacterized protein LOC133517247 isoform X1 [Cydia pomonella]
MEKLFMVLVLFVIVRAVENRHHPKFGRSYEEHEVPPLKKVSCSSGSSERSALIEDARCGAPREVFVVLKPKAAHEEIHPGAVWVKRCVGLCDHVGSDSKCVPRETTIRHIPIKISNMKTGKESCSMYELEEHLSCQCCTGSPESCAASGRVFNPRKCACQCPNLEERRNCLAKNPNMRWNRSKCACEERRRMR